jgi:hypothetical protein
MDNYPGLAERAWNSEFNRIRPSPARWKNFARRALCFAALPTAAPRVTSP